MKKENFIKTDDNKVVNQECIRWVKKMNKCMQVCTKPDGCILKLTTQTVCKNKNEESYNKLNELFE